jgi:hypothetical protein
MKTEDIELAINNYLNYNRRFVIVPNISWGLGFQHELDLLVLTNKNYVWEVEIKISKSDLKADLKKRHGHYSNKIRRLYFAVPKFLEKDALLLIPERAGLFLVERNESGLSKVELIKKPKTNLLAVPLEPQEIEHLYKLIQLRYWTLKRNLYNYQKPVILEEEKNV